ncbi:MAG: nucleoside monophosphate kinase [Candidatus Daviesbacteria bacterium]|nr:nucleoside monophosphate kinase [Candidatus Daviesbacteria bacterium]
MRVLISGPAGSGKTTQAKNLAKNLNICFFGAGEIFRKKSLEDSEIGKSLKKDLAEGNLVDNKIASQLLKEEIEQSNCSNGFVIDGYPRDIEQLQYFDPNFDKVIVLEVSKETLIKRLLKRGRFDDTKEAIEERLRIYEEETKAVLDYYQTLGIIVKIDGEKNMEEISEEIEKKLNE